MSPGARANSARDADADATRRRTDSARGSGDDKKAYGAASLGELSDVLAARAEAAAAALAKAAVTTTTDAAEGRS